MAVHNKATVPVKKRAGLNARKLQGLKYTLLALPFVLLVLAFNYVPLYSWIYSFFDYKVGHSLSSMPFVGLGNFAKLLLQREDILRVLRNTIVMSMLGILTTPLPVIFAIMLNEIKSAKFKRVVQTITTLPNFISWFVVFGIATALFSSTGLFNTILAKFGVETFGAGILGNAQYVWVFQLALSIWKSLGWSAIIYIAAIAGIDETLYEAAKVDGASKMQSILHITVPGLIPTYMVMLLLNVSNLLNNGFDQYFAFFNPLVADRIEVLDYYVYKIGILVNDYSYSIVIGMLKTLISILLLFTVNTISKRLRGESLV